MLKHERPRQMDFVQLHGITKYYGSICALSDVSLRIGPGITGLLGPNGAGKSTLIKVLLGLVRSSSGSGQVLGFGLHDEARAIRDNVGYMPEDDCYIAGQTGIETLRFAAQLAGLPSVEGLRRSHEILDFCDMQQERYRDVDTYSTGMRQKLKFAQSIIHDPRLLILDEPTSSLDPEERQAMLRRIRVLADRAGKAVIVSTHILPDVQQICDEVVILVGGKVRLVDNLETLNRPATPRLRVRVVGAADALLQRIQQERVDVTQLPDGSLSIAGDEEETAARIWRWAKETKNTISSLVPIRNSLEQIFMDAVQGDERADT